MRQQFFDQALLVYLGQTSDMEKAVERAVAALEHRDAAHAILFPPVPEEPQSRELGQGAPQEPLEEF